MNGVIEALHIYDERNPILSHTYTSRPLSAAHLLPLYLEHPAPRPPLVYLPNTNPPTLVFSLTHANLLFLLTSSSEIEPLLALEFLHRVVDGLEDFLGAPLLAPKIEASYDVVAQLLTEMCDAGSISTTEPNALRDLVEVEGFMGKLLGNLSLPGKPSAGPTPPPLLAHTSPALPWRRANVRHTSNELYADVVETLSVTLAPSGRPLAAFAHGTIAFTCKVSGVPDIVVSLAGPGGVRHSLSGLIDLPVFHPCVRLARWKERPGELSFIPPDGRFILAGYEVDLLPQPWAGGASAAGAGSGANPLKLPVSLEVRTGLGPTGADFEVKLQVHSRVLGGASSSSSSAAAAAAATGFGRGGGSLSGVGGNPQAGTPAAPTLQDVSVTVPLPADVRNLSEVRPSRGDAAYSPGDRHLEWHIPAKELAAGTAFFGLRCTVVGQTGGEGEGQEGADLDPTGFGFGSAGRDYSYDEREKPYQSSGGGGGGAAAMGGGAAAEGGGGGGGGCGEDDRDERRVAQNKILMPSSAAVSFAVRGWLPSGIRIESILIDPRKSRGLSENVKPYKGVRYLAVSKGGVEIRC